MSATPAADDARFLRAHPPFDRLAQSDVERVAAAAHPETFTAGEVVFTQGAAPVEHLHVVRSGAIEIDADGRVLDVLGEGELFGYASMLSGFAPGFTARAVQDTVCLRIGAEIARALLSAPAGLQFVARALLEEPTELHVLAREPAHNAADEPVGTLVHRSAVICAPETPVREVAQSMSKARSPAAVVPLRSGGFGIVTDSDLRNRVIAAGRDAEAPVSAIMSAPAYTCSADQPAGAVLLEMFERGLRHFPVLGADGMAIGIVEEVDLLAARTRSPLYLRQRIAEAATEEELVTASRELRPMVISLHDAHAGAANVMAVHSVCVDALTRRLLELALSSSGPAVEFAWLALGSQARREALPSSDVDSAIAWFGDGDEAEVSRALADLARQVVTGLRACGLRSDENGVNADSVLFVRSVESWQRLARSWIDDPSQEKALILASVLLDSRPVWGVHTGSPVADTFKAGLDSPELLRQLARFALSHRPALRPFRGLAVEQSGEHRGRLDLKSGGIVPILDLARWGAMSAGVTSASTPDRLRAAGEAGTLAAEDAHTLTDAFELLNNLRLEHQVGQLRRAQTPDDLLDPHEVSGLMRAQLRQALRAVASIQRRVAGELSLGAR